MKQVMFVMLTIVSLAALSGCQSMKTACGLDSGCSDCATGNCATGDCVGGDCNNGAIGNSVDGSGANGGNSKGLFSKLGQHRGYAPQDFGPPTGAVTYPYYTTRGPRDFFDANPPSIGP